MCLAEARVSTSRTSRTIVCSAGCGAHASARACNCRGLVPGLPKLINPNWLPASTGARPARQFTCLIVRRDYVLSFTLGPIRVALDSSSCCSARGLLQSTRLHASRSSLQLTCCQHLNAIVAIEYSRVDRHGTITTRYDILSRNCHSGTLYYTEITACQKPYLNLD